MFKIFATSGGVSISTVFVVIMTSLLLKQGRQKEEQQVFMISPNIQNSPHFHMEKKQKRINTQQRNEATVYTNKCCMDITIEFS